MIVGATGDVARECLGCVTSSDYDHVPGFIIALLSHGERQPEESRRHPLIRGVLTRKSFAPVHRSLTRAEVEFGRRLEV